MRRPYESELVIFIPRDARAGQAIVPAIVGRVWDEETADITAFVSNSDPLFLGKCKRKSATVGKQCWDFVPCEVNPDHVSFPFVADGYMPSPRELMLAIVDLARRVAALEDFRTSLEGPPTKPSPAGRPSAPKIEKVSERV